MMMHVHVTFVFCDVKCIMGTVSSLERNSSFVLHYVLYYS